MGKDLGMKDVEIVRGTEVDPQTLPGASEKKAGWIKRIIYPHQVGTKGIVMGVAEVNPGNPLHRWHDHIRDDAEQYELVFPENFEEIYYIIEGSGVVQWKTAEAARIREERVFSGDTVFFPAGVAKHQLFNDSNEKMRVLYCGSPLPKMTLPK